MGALTLDNIDNIALTAALHLGLAVEITLGAHHVLHVGGGILQQKTDLFDIQIFLLLLGNQRQMLFQHGFDFFIANVDGYRIFWRKLFALRRFRLLGLLHPNIIRRFGVAGGSGCNSGIRPSLLAGKSESSQQEGGRRKSFHKRFILRKNGGQPGADDFNIVSQACNPTVGFQTGISGLGQPLR